MAKKKSKAERVREQVEREMANDPTMKLLAERRAYHQAKMAEEAAAKGES
jgi:hypothetical protein